MRLPVNRFVLPLPLACRFCGVATKFLRIIYPNPAAPQATFTLTNVLGAVKREYAKMLFLRDQEGLAEEERGEYAGQVRTYQTTREVVSLAILREEAAGTGDTAIPT